MTPRSHEVWQYQYSRGDKAKPVPTLTGQAFSLPAPMTPMPGAPSPSTLLTAYRRYRATTDSALRSERRALLLFAIRQRGKGWTRTAPTAFVRPSFRRSLNPTFVAWLMGWAPGWTSFACSEMGLSRFRRRMRCELWQIASPPEAVPVQADLFG